MYAITKKSNLRFHDMGSYTETVLVLKHECGFVSDEFPNSGTEVFTDEYLEEFDRVGNAILAAGGRADNSHIHLFRGNKHFVTGINLNKADVEIMEKVGIYVTNLVVNQ
jgi:hypothetical protein